ncbi:MAG: ribosome-associated translation inhibitor RaiA [Bacilli bacterium]|nr:ribosome-associated translation inhibitor RaiA [Bacilli bacterium]
MKFNIRGSKIDVTDAINNYIETKLARLNKYFKDSGDITANVLIKTQGINQRIDVTIPIKRVILRSEEVDKDLYAAIDKVTDKLERQIRKNKTRNMRVKEAIALVDFETTKEEDIEESIVKRKTLNLKPMNEEEAILQMNLLDHPFFVFKNADTDTMSVLYKRKDGNYGIIDIDED